MTIDELIAKYYAEADDGLKNEKRPSELTRGEGTEAEYFIFKIDLCNSTMFLVRKKSQTYLKIAHVFLSTIDDITRNFGADARHAEYEGDSVIAYFPDNLEMALNVLKAAYMSRYAAIRMRGIDPSFGQFPFNTRTVLHFSTLILGRIGPWGDHSLMTMGIPLHHVAKIEEKVKPGEGIATKSFGEKLSLRERRTLLTPNYTETKIEIKSTPPDHDNINSLLGLGGLMGGSSGLGPRKLMENSPALGLGKLINPAYENNYLKNLYSTDQRSPKVEPKYEIKRELANYSINWNQIQSILSTRIGIT